MSENSPGSGNTENGKREPPPALRYFFSRCTGVIVVGAKYILPSSKYVGI